MVHEGLGTVAIAALIFLFVCWWGFKDMCVHVEGVRWGITGATAFNGNLIVVSFIK